MRIDAIVLAVFDQRFAEQLDRLTLQLIEDGCDEDSAESVLDAQRAIYAEWRTATLRDLRHGLASAFTLPAE